MLFPKLKICFVGVPKNASESIHDVLMTVDGCGRIHEHIPLDKLSEDTNYWLYSTLAVCRNPYDRFYSAYRFLVHNSMWQYTIDQTLSLVEMLTTTYPDRLLDELDPVLVPQHTYTHYIRDNECFTISNVLRYERLAQDWSGFVSRYNDRMVGHAVLPTDPLPRHNSATIDQKTHKPHWMVGLSFDQLTRIAKIYKHDFTTFGYNVNFTQ